MKRWHLVVGWVFMLAMTALFIAVVLWPWIAMILRANGVKGV